MSFDGTFPFGCASTERPPRRPSRSGPPDAFVLGVYPSALHVRWRPPRWLDEAGVVKVVGALAVDVEPIVFWDGADADERVDDWKRRVAFREGDARGEWGHVTAAGNGTSGTSVNEGVLSPLGLEPDSVWFSDAVPWYFVKRSTARGKRRQQGDAIDADYAPLAARDPHVPPASLPERPAVNELVRWAVERRRDALRNELIESEAPLLVTLGEEARRVAAGIADRIAGGPRHPLREAMDGYAESGELVVRDRQIRWLALRHPGQRGLAWEEKHQRWADSRAILSSHGRRGG